MEWKKSVKLQVALRGKALLALSLPADATDTVAEDVFVRVSVVGGCVVGDGVTKEPVEPVSGLAKEKT